MADFLTGMPGDVLTRLRAICTAFPEVTERSSHGAPTWFVRGKASFLTLWADGHHDNEFPHLWCAASPGTQEEFIAVNPMAFFRPPYVGHRGWLGVRLDRGVSWEELAEIAEDAYRVVAPPKLISKMTGERASQRSEERSESGIEPGGAVKMTGE